MTLIRCVPLIMTISLAGCANPAQWAAVGTHEVLSTDQIEADWPQGWMTLRPSASSEEASKDGVLFMVTRDGFGLQTISLSRRPLDGGFRYTQKRLVAGMVPQEVAELVLNNVRANHEVVDLKIIDNSPSILAGAQAFKLNYTYRSKSGLLRQSIQYGCIDRGMLVTLSYDAPKRHYFSHDLATFETVKNSVRWKS